MHPPDIRPIPDAPSYFASPEGSIFSDKGTQRRKLRPAVHNGRERVRLYIGETSRVYDVAILVCRTFHGPQPAGHHVLFDNGNRRDVRAANLRWATLAEIMAHPLTRRTVQPGEKHPRAKLRVADVLEIRRRAAAREPRAHIAADYGIDPTHLGGIVTGRYWRHLAA